MKTKLTLNIDSTIITRAKKRAGEKKMSLSSVVEGYLQNFSDNPARRNVVKKKTTITERIKKLTKPVQISDKDVKTAWHKHLEEKYGK